LQMYNSTGSNQNGFVMTQHFFSTLSSPSVD
jgi:hypothetical protein